MGSGKIAQLDNSLPLPIPGFIQFFKLNKFILNRYKVGQISLLTSRVSRESMNQNT